MKYKTIILSDIHLGSKYSRAKDVTDFLTKNTAETIILNGDIIDGWALKRGGVWTDEHMKCVRKLMKLSKSSTVYWIRGNHDDFLYDFIPFDFGKIMLRESMEYRGLDKNKYLILHGDIFDVFVDKWGWLAKIGSVGYDMTLWINKWYNKYRTYRGLPYFSLSQKIKASVKTATNFIGDFENHMVTHARSLECDGVICGHIHKAEIRDIDGMIYMNSGDWVESNTALVETLKGKWKIINY
jgi:UDP-2,3-diacylglucosamine pyrophosphatase LpxH